MPVERTPEEKKCGNCRFWKRHASYKEDHGRCTNPKNPERHIYLYHKDGWCTYRVDLPKTICPWHKFRRTK